MSLERIGTGVKLPYRPELILSNDPRKLNVYIRELLQFLEELQDQIISLMNLGVDLTDGNAVYFATKNEAGEYPEGTWRLIPVGENLERQKLTSGIWKTAGTWEPAL